MPDTDPREWRAREAAAEPRGVPLDPTREPVPGIQAFTSVYVPGHLIISGDPAPALGALRDAATEFGWGVADETIAPPVGSEDASATRDMRITRATIFSDPSPVRDDQPVPPIDAWRLLQRARLRQIEPNPDDAPAPGPLSKRVDSLDEEAKSAHLRFRGLNLRAAASVDRSRRTEIPAPATTPASPKDPLRSVGLDHVLSIDPVDTERYAKTNPTSLSRYAKTNPTAGTEPYSVPGTGGLEVVTFVGKAPQHAELLPADVKDKGGRRPVVAFVDTGCGEHDWLPERTGPDQLTPWVWRSVPAPQPTTALNRVVGVDEESTNPEVNGDQSGPRDGFLDGSSGHGTFVAGIIRQASPDANIIAVRVADSDGTVLESELIGALEELVVKKARGEIELDILNLSLGFYHETPEDGRFSTRLFDVLKELRSKEVIVVCSAGNDATDRPAFPAALTAWTGSDLNLDESGALADHLAVGALNPNGKSVALYSNIGNWVSHFAPGTSVLSTTPPLKGGLQAGSRADLYDRRRMTIDGDDFTGGFAIWSGTSFAAPYVAGVIAQSLAKQLMTSGTRDPGAVKNAIDELAKMDRSDTRVYNDDGELHSK